MGHHDIASLPFPAGIRAIRPDDADAILAGLLGALERDELEGVTRHFLEESANRIRHEPWLGAVAIEDDRVAGWVIPHHDDLTVDLPFRRRGHGRRLVEAGRLIAGHEGDDLFRVWVPRRPGAQAFARAVGLAYHSSLWKLRLDHDAPREPAVFPESLVVRWVEPGPDDEAVVELFNTTFLDHPSPLNVELETIRRVHGSREFDPSTILLVARRSDPDRLLGFCRVGTYHDDDGRLVGEVKLVGVRREARGEGIGRALVRWGIEACRERGAEEIYLAVEGENEGALRLYESLGFGRDTEWPHWVAPAIRPVRAPASATVAGGRA